MPKPRRPFGDDERLSMMIALGTVQEKITGTQYGESMVFLILKAGVRADNADNAEGDERCVLVGVGAEFAMCDLGDTLRVTVERL